MDVQVQITHTILYFLFFIVQYVQTYYKHLFSARPSVEEEEGYAGILRSTNEVLNAPIVVSKVDASLEVTEKPDAEITTLDDLSESKLDAPIVETSLKESTLEESDSVLTEKEDLDGPQLEKCAKEEKFDNESDAVTDGTSQGGLVKMSFDEDMFYSIYMNITEAKKPTTLKDVLGIAISASAKKPDHAAKKDEFLLDCGTSQEGSLKMSFDEDLFYSIYVNVTEAKKPTTLKDLLAIAKSQSTKNIDVKALNDKKGNLMSPPKLFEDGKKGRKKVKGVRSWLPFVSCFPINVVDEKVMPIQ